MNRNLGHYEMKASDLHINQYQSFPEFARYGIDLSLTHADVVLTLQAIRASGGFAKQEALDIINT